MVRVALREVDPHTQSRCPACRHFLPTPKGEPEVVCSSCDGVFAVRW